MRIVLVAHKYILGLEIAMDVAFVVKLFEPNDALICDSFHIEHADSGLVDDVLQILTKQRHDEAAIILPLILYSRKSITVLHFAHDLTLPVDQGIRVLGRLCLLYYLNARGLEVKHLVNFAEGSLANFINHLVPLWQVLG